MKIRKLQSLVVLTFVQNFILVVGGEVSVITFCH